MDSLDAPLLEPVVRLVVHVGPPQDAGLVGAGRRRLVPILGGELLGPMLTGRVLPGGADFQLLRPDHVAELDARYLLELRDGTPVFVTNRALRRASPEVSERLTRGEPADPAQVYFRCQPRFEVADGPWRWLAQSVFVGTGVRRPDRVEMMFFRVA